MKSNKFLNATQIFIKACYVLLALFAIASTWLFIWIFGLSKGVIALIVPFILVIPAGYTVLICLDKLLANIKNDIIFDQVNIEKFKKISICCFYAAIIGIIAGTIFIIIDSVNYIIAVPILILACGEAFMGLITIVIKIVFNRAIEIKNENDLTI